LKRIVANAVIVIVQTEAFMSFDQSFRYLDSESDRQALLDEIRQVRRAVISMTETVPEDKWYEARYHGWSLAAMLGHLQMMDNLNMMLVQMALVGVRLPISISVVNSLIDVTSQVFQRRLVKTTIKGIEQKQRTLEKFILGLPVDQFSRQVFYPPMNRYLTIEQALQVLFLHHWQNHLQTMLDVEGIQPRDTSAN
jgi:predicted phosphohydrolase